MENLLLVIFMPKIYQKFTQNMIYLKQTRNLSSTFRLNNEFLPVIYPLFNRNIRAIFWINIG